MTVSEWIELASFVLLLVGGVVAWAVWRATVDNKLAAVDEFVDSLKEKIEAMETDVEKQNERLLKVEFKSETAEKWIGEIRESIHKTRNDIGELKLTLVEFISAHKEKVQR